MHIHHPSRDAATPCAAAHDEGWHARNADDEGEGEVEGGRPVFQPEMDELKDEPAQSSAPRGTEAPVGGVPALPPRTPVLGAQQRAPASVVPPNGDLSRHLAAYLSSSDSPQTAPAAHSEQPLPALPLI